MSGCVRVISKTILKEAKAIVQSLWSKDISQALSSSLSPPSHSAGERKVAFCQSAATNASYLVNFWHDGDDNWAGWHQVENIIPSPTPGYLYTSMFLHSAVFSKVFSVSLMVHLSGILLLLSLQYHLFRSQPSGNVPLIILMSKAIWSFAFYREQNCAKWWESGWEKEEGKKRWDYF